MLAPFAVSVHVPVLPAIGEALTGDPRGAASSVSAFLWVFGGAMLVVGPLSDRFGRRRLILAGLGIYGAGSALAAAAPSLSVLLAARGLQAFGAASLVIVPRAMVRDAFDETTKPMARLATLQSMAPALAPPARRRAGGVVRVAFDLRVPHGRGGVALAPRDRAPGDGTFLRDTPRSPRWGRLALVSVVGAAASAVYFALLPVAPDVLAPFGHGAQVVGVALVGVAAGFVGGAALVPRLERAWGRGRASAIAGALLLAATLLAVLGTGPFALSAGLALYALAAGALLPLTVAEGLEAAPGSAGRAASVLGAVQLGAGAAASSLVEAGVAFSEVAAGAAVLGAMASLPLASVPRRAASSPLVSPTC